MKRLWLGRAAAAALLCAGLAAAPPAMANYLVKDGSGATQTFCSVIAGSVHTPCHATTDTSNTGSLTASVANSAYTVTLGHGEGVVAFTVSGLTAAGAVLTVEGTNDGSTWSAINKVDGGTGGLATTLSADGQFRLNAGGRKGVRLRISTTGSGAIVVSSNASAASSEMTLTTPLPPGTNRIGTVGLDGNSVTPVASTSVEACHVLKASAGELYGFTLTTTSSASANDWIMVFDAASAPADGAVTPKEWGRISANGQYAYAAPAGATIHFAAGVTVCLSTTGPLTKTAEAQAVISGKAQ